jgi:hypothetical protein
MMDDLENSENLPAIQLTSMLTRSHLNMWRELTCLALIFMELCWIAPLYHLLARFPTGVDLQRSFIVLGLILLSAYLQARLTEQFALNTIYRIIIFTVFLVISLLIGLRTLAYFHDEIGLGETVVRFIKAINHIDIWIPKEFGVCLVVLLLGLNGFSIATGLPDPFRVYRRFWASILMLLFFGLLTSDNPINMPSIMLYIFLLTSLLAMAASRLALLGRLRGGQRIPFDMERVLGVWFFGIGMAGLSLLAAFLFQSQPVFSLIYGIYLLMIRVVFVFLAILLLPVYLILFYILPGIKLPLYIAPVIQSLVDLIHQIQLLIARLPEVNFSSLLQAILVLKPFILWGLVILGIFMILIIVRKWTKRRTFDNDVDDSQESFLTGGLMNSLRAGLRKGIVFFVQNLVQRLSLTSGESRRAAARIRRIYAELIDLSARLGSPRPESFTPLEFLPLLIRQLPRSASDLDLITQAYIRIRYGEMPEYKQHLDEVEAAWTRIKDEFPNKK